jgi:hypothetical protein
MLETTPAKRPAARGLRAGHFTGHHAIVRAPIQQDSMFEGFNEAPGSSKRTFV